MGLKSKNEIMKLSFGNKRVKRVHIYTLTYI